MTQITQPIRTSRGPKEPTLRQFSTLIEDQVGQLNGLLRYFRDRRIGLIAMALQDNGDCAVVRMVFDRPDSAERLLLDLDVTTTQTEVICVELPASSEGLLAVCSALARAEINIVYMYPLMRQPGPHPAVLMRVDQPVVACEALTQTGFRVLTENDFLS